MKILIAALLSFVPLLIGGAELSPSWILHGQFDRVIREQGKGLSIGGAGRGGGAVGGSGSNTLGPNILGHTSTLYLAVSSTNGFAPDLVRAAMDSWFRSMAVTTVRGSSIGAMTNSFVSHDWAYYDAKAGIVGTLTIWFPDTRTTPMRMVVVIDEQRDK